MKANAEAARDSAAVQLFKPEGRAPAQRTVVVFGMPRGGTSAVAGALVGLGVPMGENLPNNFEDPKFAEARVPDMVKTIALRNQSLPVWGWKFPNAANHLDLLRPHLRNPHLIIVYRDMVATMKGLMRWHDREKLQAISDITQHLQKNTMLVLRWSVPTLLVSYEKAVRHPEAFVQELAAFVDVPAPADLTPFRKFLEPESYKSFEAA